MPTWLERYNQEVAAWAKEYAPWRLKKEDPMEHTTETPYKLTVTVEDVEGKKTYSVSVEAKDVWRLKDAVSAGLSSIEDAVQIELGHRPRVTISDNSS